MKEENKINQFNQENDPFYIVEHNDGSFYSLCLPFDRLSNEDYFRFRKAFDDYAKSIGETVMEGNLYRYGSGYDWAATFKKAFENDPKLSQITFDCEAGGFFCDCKDLSVLEDFGRRFKMITDNDEQFARYVAEGIPQENARREVEEELKNTLRGFFMEHPIAEYDIQTPDGYINLPSEFGMLLANGELSSVITEDDGVEIDAEDFLNYRIDKVQRDLFNENHFQIKAEPPIEQTMTQNLN